MKPTSIPRVSLTKSVLTRFSTLLHPPLLSSLESRKFLSLVKDSFRSQLNADAPPVAPTDEHLGAVLATPPFSGTGDGRGRVKRFFDDPIGVFREQVLVGKADIELAALCLTKHARLVNAKAAERKASEKAGIERAAPPAAAEGERKEEKFSAVAVVFEGLRQTGLGGPKEVLKDEKLLRAVAASLVADGQDEIIMRWARCTRAEAPDWLRRNIVKFGVYEAMVQNGWENAASLFRRIMAGERVNEGKFSRSEFSTTGVKMCEWGMNSGFSGTPTYKKLVKSAAIWATHWEMEARVNLKYTKQTGVGVKFFKYLSGAREDFWRNQSPSWYQHASALALDLAGECLIQGQVREADMISEVVKNRFEGKVPELGVKLDAGRGRRTHGRDVAHKGVENSEHSDGLQGILNGLG